MMPEESVGIIGFANSIEIEKKINNFLKKIYETDVANSKVWEKEIFSFFSKEIIIPFFLTISKEDKFEEDKKNIYKNFFEPIMGNHKIVCWDSNNMFKQLVKIYDDLKVGIKLEEYAPFFFLNNQIIRRMTKKKIDKEDDEFKNYKSGIHPVRYEIEMDNKKYFKTFFFMIPDSSITYPFDKYMEEIDDIIKRKLKNKSTNNKRKPIDSKLRHECFKRDNYRCVECGATNKETILHADHIIPVSQGGTDELENLQTLCDGCNIAKSNKKWVGGKLISKEEFLNEVNKDGEKQLC